MRNDCNHEPYKFFCDKCGAVQDADEGPWRELSSDERVRNIALSELFSPVIEPAIKYARKYPEKSNFTISSQENWDTQVKIRLSIEVVS